AKYNLSREYNNLKRQTNKESKKPGLYKDNYMSFFHAKELEEHSRKVMGVFYDVPGLRHKMILQQLSKIYKNCKIEQTIILGAGLDTTAVRKRKWFPEESSKVYELDMPEVMEAKQEIYNAKIGKDNIPKNIHYIACNYLKENFIERLQMVGLDLNKPTCFIWEGNVYYLKETQIIEVLGNIKNKFKNTYVVLDAPINPIVLTENLEAMIENFKKMNAPWFLDNEKISEMANKIGFDKIEQWVINDAIKEYTNKYDIAIEPNEDLEQVAIYTLHC
ncbi:MAG TPA: class I SAM-dependent methyltransferase, partial [Bacteroidia bacterium]|nr:class I SAM-dependent methyltransferase [Bacteroidia bacterium]